MKRQHLTVIGCGLIGSSVLRAARRRFPSMHLTAVDSDAETCRYLEHTRLADTVTADAGGGVREADLIVLAVPVPALESVARAIAGHLQPDARVTDVASVKAAAWQAVAPHLPESVAFIPAHPIAGREVSGAEEGLADLFEGKRVILTPPQPEMEGAEEVAEFWRALGAIPEFMPPELHDRIYASVSHLPQYLAFIISRLYEKLNVKPQLTETFRRFTRLSGSDTLLWQGIFDANNSNLANSLEKYLHVLQQIRGELEKGASDQEAAAPDAKLVATLLFPHIAASCLISVVAMEERELGIPLKRYAGTGFADFTAPAHAEPEKALELISAHAAETARLLADFSSLLTAAQ